MTCIFHEIGAPARLIKRRLVSRGGRRQTIEPYTLGIVKGIDNSQHKLQVYFENIDVLVTLPADAFEKPRRMAELEVTEVV